MIDRKTNRKIEINKKLNKNEKGPIEQKCPQEEQQLPKMTTVGRRP